MVALYRHHARTRGFTLTELIVAIVVLGLLAGLAVPAFQAVTDRSRVHVRTAEVVAIGREAAALAAFNGDGSGWSQTEWEQAVADTATASDTLLAAGDGRGFELLTGSQPVTEDDQLHLHVCSGGVAGVAALVPGVDGVAVMVATDRTGGAHTTTVGTDESYVTGAAALAHLGYDTDDECATRTEMPQASAPAAPSPASTLEGVEQLTVTWTAPDDTVERYTVTGQTGDLSATVDAPATQVTFEGLTAGTTYDFAVVAHNAVGASDAATTSGVPNEPMTAPSQPTITTTDPGNEQFTVSWEPPLDDGGSDLTSYELRTYDTATATLVNETTDIAPTATDNVVSGLSYTDEYRFELVAVNDVGQSAPHSKTDRIGGVMTLAFDTALDDAAGGGTGQRDVTVPIGGDTVARISWGDGNFTDVDLDAAAPLVHTYETEGPKDVTIEGRFGAFSASTSAVTGLQAGNMVKLTEVGQWDDETLTVDASWAFRSSSVTAVAEPPSTVTTMAAMFYDAAAFNGDISGWTPVNVQDMTQMFAYATAFNQPIGSWGQNTRNVKSMASMFHGTATGNRAFNQDISAWNTSNVTDMTAMFSGSGAFNQAIGAWDTSSVTDMSSMFFHNETFNNGNSPDISNWDTSSVTDMERMFYRAAAFDQDLNGNWNTSSVTDMKRMFYLAGQFNGDVTTWNTSNVKDMSWMFHGADAFNQPIGNLTWDTGSVTNMERMFSSADSFNQPIGDWNTVKVTSMKYMFYSADVFDQDLGSWPVAGVTDCTGFADLSGYTTAAKPDFTNCTP